MPTARQKKLKDQGTPLDLFEGRKRIFDYFTEMDDELVEINEAAHDTNVHLENMHQQLIQLVELQKISADGIQKLIGYMKRVEPAYISWPSKPGTAGTGTLPAGETDFDFIEGDVVFGDQSTTKDKMTNSLRALKDDTIRSFYIWADNDIIIRTEATPKRLVQRQKDFLVTYQSLEHLFITATRETQIMLWGSTAPDPRYGGIPNPGLSRIHRSKTSQDLSADALSYTTTLATPFKLNSILCRFSAAVSPTFNVYLASKDGSSYDTVLFNPTVTAAQNVNIAADEGYKYEAGDQIRVEISSVAAIAYLTIVTTEV